MKQNILVIDDDKTSARLSNCICARRATRSRSGGRRDRRRPVFGKQYDLVILDIMMPVQDGIETIKQIRQNRTVPVIMLTAKGETFDKVLALELGADDYIVNPSIRRSLSRAARQSSGAVHRKINQISSNIQTSRLICRITK